MQTGTRGVGGESRAIVEIARVNPEDGRRFRLPVNMPEYYFLPKRMMRAMPALQGTARRLEGALVRGYFALLERLSLRAANRVAYQLFAVVGALTPRRTKMIANLAVAFPDKDARELKRLSRRCFGNFGVAFAELSHARQIWSERRERIEWVVDPGIRVVRGSHKPAVFVTGHIGAWQLGNFVAAHFDVPITMIFAPESNPAVDEVVQNLRERLPVKSLPRDNVMRQLIGELTQGNSIGMAGDTRLDEGEEIPFFGVGALTNTVPARLALRHRCELIAVCTERLPGERFRITLRGPIEPDDPTGDTAAQALQMTARLNALFEDWIRATPDQWACFARRWPKQVARDALRSRGVSA